MLINPSKPFITKILSIVCTKDNKRYAKIKYIDGALMNVHIYEGQSLSKGDEIECIAETFDKYIEVHQTRKFLYNSLYKKGNLYSFRVIHEGISYIDYNGVYYLKVLDERSSLSHRLYIDYDAKENDYEFLTIIRGSYVRCEVGEINENNIDLKCKYIERFNYYENSYSSEYGSFFLLKENVFDFIDRAHKRLKCENPIEGSVFINFGEGYQSYDVKNYVGGASEKVVINKKVIEKDKPCASVFVINARVDELFNNVSKNIDKRKWKGYKSVDYVAKQEKNIEIGTAGEEWVVQYEQNKLNELGLPNLANKVRWVSKDLGDGLGYDIISYDSDTLEEIYIEVKTTVGHCDNEFFISRNELNASKEIKNYYLYRLFNYEKDANQYNLLIIKGDLSNLCTVPVSYSVRLDY